jgi:hypothetical protein
MRLGLALAALMVLGGCTYPLDKGLLMASPAPEAVKPAAAPGKRIVFTGAGQFTLPDGTTVVADENGGFTLPNGAYVARDSTGSVTLPNGAHCAPDDAGGYVCP